VSTLPDPTESLIGDDRSTYMQMAAVRGEGRLGDVYVRMFNNPRLAGLVGQLGEHLRYHGILPGDVRELVVLHIAQRMRTGYEWSHHVRLAADAGLDAGAVAALAEGREPDGLRPDQQAALDAADAVFDLDSIPEGVQAVLIDAYGAAGVVELAVLVGMYRLVAGFVAGFDVSLEHGFPRSPF